MAIVKKGGGSYSISEGLTCIPRLRLHALVLLPAESVSLRPFQHLDADREATDPEVCRGVTAAQTACVSSMTVVVVGWGGGAQTALFASMYNRLRRNPHATKIYIGHLQHC